MKRAAFLVLLLVGCGCSSTENVIGVSSSSSSSGGAGDDAGADARALPSGKPTALATLMGGVARPIDRAQFGLDDGKLRIEAHAGGDPACPTEQSPTTDRTIVIANLPKGASGAIFTEADNVKVSYFDFGGEQIPDVPIARSTKVTITMGYSDDAIAEIDLEAEFPEGTITGHATAAFCASLSL